MNYKSGTFKDGVLTIDGYSLEIPIIAKNAKSASKETVDSLIDEHEYPTQDRLACFKIYPLEIERSLFVAVRVRDSKSKTINKQIKKIGLINSPHKENPISLFKKIAKKDDK